MGLNSADAPQLESLRARTFVPRLESCPYHAKAVARPDWESRLLSFHWGTLPRLESACRHFCHAARTHKQEPDKLVLRPLVLVSKAVACTDSLHTLARPREAQCSSSLQAEFS